MATGCVIGFRAWRALYTCGAAGVAPSLMMGLVLAGIVLAALDLTLRMRGTRTEEEWTRVAFDAEVGGRIDGLPAWIVGILVSVVAMITAPTL